jgi:hypothetical protein
MPQTRRRTSSLQNPPGQRHEHGRACRGDVSLFAIRLRGHYLAIASLGFAVITYLIQLRSLVDQLIRSPAGEALIAVREDEVSAASPGVDCRVCFRCQYRCGRSGGSLWEDERVREAYLGRGGSRILMELPTPSSEGLLDDR